VATKVCELELFCIGFDVNDEVALGLALGIRTHNHIGPWKRGVVLDRAINRRGCYASLVTMDRLGDELGDGRFVDDLMVAILARVPQLARVGVVDEHHVLAHLAESHCIAKSYIFASFM